MHELFVTILLAFAAVITAAIILPNAGAIIGALKGE